jgi:ABC-type antimicrobial peptide transport system permease subunit
MYALVGLGVALLGVYSVISYMTAFRNYEFGIRMAMGARPADVLLLVAREGLLLASLGIFIGTILSLYAARLLKGLVFGIKPLDPSTFVVASVVLLGGCLIATLIPAARAARCDPWETLKSG